MAAKRRSSAKETPHPVGPVVGNVFDLSEMTALRLGVLGAALEASIFAMLWTWDDLAAPSPRPEGLDRADALKFELATREKRRRAIARTRSACNALLATLDGFHPDLERGPNTRADALGPYASATDGELYRIASIQPTPGQ